MNLQAAIVGLVAVLAAAVQGSERPRGQPQIVVYLDPLSGAAFPQGGRRSADAAVSKAVEHLRARLVAVHAVVHSSDVKGSDAPQLEERLSRASLLQADIYIGLAISKPAKGDCLWVHHPVGRTRVPENPMFDVGEEYRRAHEETRVKQSKALAENIVADVRRSSPKSCVELRATDGLPVLEMNSIPAVVVEYRLSGVGPHVLSDTTLLDEGFSAICSSLGRIAKPPLPLP